MLTNSSSRENRQQPLDSYGRVAVRGSMWVAATTALGKISSFLAQLVLGWLLSEDDYALYATAIAISSLVSVLYDGGMAKILIQRGHEYTSLARAILSISLVFNGLAATVLIVISLIATYYYQSTTLALLLGLIGLSAILGTPGMVYKSRLTIDLQFARIAEITSKSLLLQYSSMILFAIVGLGPISFALPQILIRCYEWLAYRQVTGGIPHNSQSQPLTWTLFRSLFADSRWIMLGTLATALVMNGDYLMVSIIKPELLGIYFFAYQLTTAFAAPLTAGFQAVLMPAFSRLNSQSGRQIAAYLRAIQGLIAVTAPIFIGITLTLEAAIHILWAGKWDSAIAASEILMLSMIFRITNPLGRAFLEAKGRWHLQSGLLWLDAMGTMLSAVFGAWIGSLIGLSLSVCLWKVVFSILQLSITHHVAGISLMEVMKAVFPVLLISSGCGVVTGIIVDVLLTFSSPYIKLINILFLFFSIYFITALIFIRPQYKMLIKSIKTY